MMSNLSELVGNLPELYQPIFNHPTLSGSCSRESADRLQEIIKTYKTLENELGRPLRVLDLGCAQGFFSLSLGSLGAKVHGVDYSERNIELCQALADENPTIKIKFEFNQIEDVLSRVLADEYDLVLGLSVFHHLVYLNGIDNVISLLNKILNVSSIFIAEFALKEEPLYWGESQPENPRDLLKDAIFVHEVARYDTHLAEIRRPLYVASNKYWCLDSQIGVIKSHTSESHALAGGAHLGKRKYFWSDECFVKVFQTDGMHGDTNKAELLREADFLRDPIVGISAPKFYLFGENSFESWLVVERIPGELLLDVIHKGAEFQVKKVIGDVLKQLVELERCGLYHGDLRVWNVLLDPQGGARLIDFGSLTHQAKDCVWPNNVFLSFLVFVKEVALGKLDIPDLRQTLISPFSLPAPFNIWVSELWKLSPDEWSFHRMLEYYNASALSEERVEVTSIELWMGIVDESVLGLRQHINHVQHLVEVRLQGELESKLSSSEKFLDFALRDAELWMTKATSLEEKLLKLEDEVRASFERVSAMEQSTSWRLTAPMRTASRLGQGLPGRVVRKGGRILKSSLVRVMRAGAKNSALLSLSKRVLIRFPYLYQKLRVFAHSSGLFASHENILDKSNANVDGKFEPDSTPLSPRAKLILSKIRSNASNKGVS